MPRWKSWLRTFLEGVRIIPHTDYVTTLVTEHPDVNKIGLGIIYVVGGRDFRKWAYLRCPCGCGARILLSLSASKRPRWQVTWDWLDRATVEPSIRQTAGEDWARRSALSGGSSLSLSGSLRSAPEPLQISHRQSHSRQPRKSARSRLY